MKIYASKPMLIARILVAGFIPIIFGSAMLISHIPTLTILGILLISLPALLLIRHIKFPQIQIDNNQLRIINVFGFLRELGEVSSLAIVANKNDILIQTDNGAEYSLGRQFLTQKNWQSMANELSMYKFKSYKKCF